MTTQQNIEKHVDINCHKSFEILNLFEMGLDQSFSQRMSFTLIEPLDDELLYLRLPQVSTIIKRVCFGKIFTVDPLLTTTLVISFSPSMLKINSGQFWSNKLAYFFPIRERYHGEASYLIYGPNKLAYFSLSDRYIMVRQAIQARGPISLFFWVGQGVKQRFSQLIWHL